MNNHRHERLSPTVADEFMPQARTPDDGRIITFIRNGEKRVTGLTIELWRIKGITFEKLAEKTHCTRLGLTVSVLSVVLGRDGGSMRGLEPDGGPAYPGSGRIAELDAAGFWISQGQVDEAALEAEMNRLGSQGWELVSVFDTNRGGGGTRDVIAVFKRPAG